MNFLEKAYFFLFLIGTPIISLIISLIDSDFRYGMILLSIWAAIIGLIHFIKICNDD